MSSAAPPWWGRVVDFSGLHGTQGLEKWVLPAEAQWIGNVVAGLPSASFPLLNVGSQTAEFRSVTQPWVAEQIFAGLEALEYPVWHVDIQDVDRVDLVADIGTDDGYAKVATVEARSILCSNLLEHVETPIAFLNRLVGLLLVGGHLIVTRPTSYPRHPDPIDNLFRPSVDELVVLVTRQGNMTVVGSAQIAGGTYGSYLAARHGRLRLAARLAMPLRRPDRWREIMTWLRRPISCYAIHARKTGTGMDRR